MTIEPAATSGAEAPIPTAIPENGFLGHPRGLSVLFFTEMWERFSYYGMRALLILFMTAAVADGGLGFDVARAGAIYGLYTASVYLTALPGGWIADRVIGQQRAVLLGGIVIALGHFSMAVPALTGAFGETPPFFAGLVLIALGTGLLKPNASTLVGELYPDGDDARRDAGFSIFYMGINVGAFSAPLITSYLGEQINWHLGFAAAGIGMTVGVVQYVLGREKLGNAGERIERAAAGGGQVGRMVAGFALLFAVLAALQFSGMADLTTAVGLASASGLILLVLCAIYFGWLYAGADLNAVERKRVGAIIVFFVFSALFWAGFEQAGSSLNLFARDLTDRVVGGWEMPAGFLQSVNSLFIIALAPVFAWLWVATNRRGVEPRSPAKFALGLIFLGAGFAVMTVASMRALAAGPVSPMWLVVTYLLHTIGELSLSPVGLSTVTKLAPKRMVGQMMGIWFLSMSLGNLVAGQVAGLYGSLPLPELFGSVAATVGVGGVLLFLLSGLVTRLMAGVR